MLSSIKREFKMLLYSSIAAVRNAFLSLKDLWQEIYTTLKFIVEYQKTRQWNLERNVEKI